MRPYDGQREVLETIEERLATPGLDAESLGRAVLILEWFVRSGLVAQEDVERMLAERLVGGPR